MKSLYNILESLLDNEDEIFVNAGKHIKSSIKDFLKQNFYGVSKCKISKKPNDDGKYVVDCSGSIAVKNKSITSLTNGRFVWGEVKGNFYCDYCKSLTSLEGAPEKVGGYFTCSDCDSLKSLEGAPKEIKGNFYCSGCKSLKSLEGAPKEVGRSFDCSYCKSLTSLKGAPEKVGGVFNCSGCDSLKTLEGAPKEVGEDFYCTDCPSLKSYDVDSNIRGNIIYQEV